MCLVAWLLAGVAVVLLMALACFAVLQHEKIVCLRYCYQMLAFTPEVARATALEYAEKLMEDNAMPPIRSCVPEPRPLSNQLPRKHAGSE